MSVEVKDLPEVNTCNSTDCLIVDDGTTTSKIQVQNLKKVILPFASYKAQVSQSGTNDPSVTVIENSLDGDIVWTRISQGVYNGNLTGAFPDSNKIFTTPGARIASSTVSSSTFFWDLSRVDADNIQIKSVHNGLLSDDALSSSPIQIQVYF